MAEIIETPNAAIERDGEAELRKIQKIILIGQMIFPLRRVTLFPWMPKPENSSS